MKIMEFICYFMQCLNRQDQDDKDSNTIECMLFLNDNKESEKTNNKTNYNGTTDIESPRDERKRKKKKFSSDTNNKNNNVDFRNGIAQGGLCLNCLNQCV